MLQEAEDYNNPDIIIPLPEENGYTRFTVKPGTLLFRGDHEQKMIPAKEVPIFFSDAVSALIYTRGQPDYLSAYKIKKQPTLFQLSYANLTQLLLNDKRLTDEEHHALNKYLEISKHVPPHIIPVQFLKKENAEGVHKLYLNRRILNIICRLGYDGWIALPDTLLQRNMDTEYYKMTGKLRYKLNIYNPEIAICKWDTFLDSRND